MENNCSEICGNVEKILNLTREKDNLSHSKLGSDAALAACHDRISDLEGRATKAIKREIYIKELEDTLDELANLMQGVIEGDYKPDSLTLQPAEIILGKTWESNDE